MSTNRSFDDNPHKLTSEQVGELLGHPRKQCEVWAREGTLPTWKEPGSRRWWFDRDELVGWVRQHRVVPEN